MAKPPVKMIPSDDCIITVEDVEYNLHEGEHITAVVAASPGDLHQSIRLQQFGQELEAVDTDEERQLLLIRGDEILENLVGFIAARVISWDWTDDLGNALPQPAHNPDVLRQLRWEELFYLQRILTGTNPAQLKNGGRPSPTTSSATKSRRNRGK